MKKYIANGILIIISLVSLCLIVYQIGSPIVLVFKQHGFIGLFASLFAFEMVFLIAITIVKIVNWAVKNNTL